MTKKEASAHRAPGRPRSTESRAAILKAAYQILREGGFSRFTVEGVAARAGAGKATIYRWWTSKGTLAVEAFLVAVAPRMDAVRESDSPIADLRKQVHLAAAIYRAARASSSANSSRWARRTRKPASCWFRISCARAARLR